jgi:hypothetical protein
MLHVEMWGGRTTVMVQYWRSFEHLHAYARMRVAQHLPAWADFNRRIGSNGDFGIWHETFMVKAGQYEAVYNNMPEFGLAKAGGWVPAAGKQNTAKGRLQLSDGSDEPVYEEDPSCPVILTKPETKPGALLTASEGRLENSLTREVVGRDLSASVEMTGWCVPDGGMVYPR